MDTKSSVIPTLTLTTIPPPSLTCSLLFTQDILPGISYSSNLGIHESILHIHRKPDAIVGTSCLTSSSPLWYRYLYTPQVNLCSLLSLLGSHSINSRQLKRLLNLIQFQDGDRSLPPLASHLLTVVQEMIIPHALNDNGVKVILPRFPNLKSFSLNGIRIISYSLVPRDTFTSTVQLIGT